MNDRETAFIERMTAMATHEIMNGLASIGQATGLMNDLLSLGVGGGRGGLLGCLGLGRKKDPGDATARFKKSLANVQSGMGKSLETTKALNSFIHGLTPSDEPVAAIEILEVMTVLMRRPARQKKMEFKKEPCERDTGVHVPAFGVYRALAACVDELLENAGAGAVIEVSCGLESGQAVFTVSSPGFRQTSDFSDAMKQTMHDLETQHISLKSIEAGYSVSVTKSQA
jgi:hypothetical protein